MQAGDATAQGGSLFPLDGPAPVNSAAPYQSASLFADTDNDSSLFAPSPVRTLPPRGSFAPLNQSTLSGPIAHLLDLIATAEAGPDGYNAVQHGATVRPTKPPTQMRIAEIRTWVAATPGQPHAIGRYQFIPDTFNSLIRQLGIPDSALFSPAVQDQMAHQLLFQAGLTQFLHGELSRTGFMNALAKVWAGLPNSSGQSHYHGYAGNRATTTWARFDAEMQRIFPAGSTLALY